MRTSLERNVIDRVEEWITLFPIRPHFAADNVSKWICCGSLPSKIATLPEETSINCKIRRHCHRRKPHLETTAPIGRPPGQSGSPIFGGSRSGLDQQLEDWFSTGIAQSHSQLEAQSQSPISHFLSVQEVRFGPAILRSENESRANCT